MELKNQELEKFRYVLHYKIDELTRLIRPREEEIERMKDQLLQVTALISQLFVRVCVSRRRTVQCEIHRVIHSVQLINERKLNLFIRQFTFHCLVCCLF